MGETGETPWPPVLRYRFYRAWNVAMLGAAGAALSPVFQFVEAVALVFFLGGAVVTIGGAMASRAALREAGRSSGWRNYMPRFDDLPPVAVRRLDPDDVDLRRSADACTAALVVAIVVGYTASMVLT